MALKLRLLVALAEDLIQFPVSTFSLRSCSTVYLQINTSHSNTWSSVINVREEILERILSDAVYENNVLICQNPNTVDNDHKSINI